MTEEHTIYETNPEAITWEFMARISKDGKITESYSNKSTGGFYSVRSEVGVYDLIFLEALPRDLDYQKLLVVCSVTEPSQSKISKKKAGAYKRNGVESIRVVVSDDSGAYVDGEVCLYARW